MPKLSPVDRVLFSLALLSLIATVIYSSTNQAAFRNWFAIEDGPVEWGGTICLLLSSLVLLRNALSLMGKGRPGAAALTGFYALLFFFASGEEISWGQRIFGWESGAFFTHANAQHETNIHNLVIGHIKLAKTLFGSGLTAVLLLYLVVLPFAYALISPVQRLANRLALPVPYARHAVVIVIASAVMVSVHMLYQWEVYETVFSMMALSIFLRPRNAAYVT